MEEGLVTITTSIQTSSLTELSLQTKLLPVKPAEFESPIEAVLRFYLFESFQNCFHYADI